MLFVAFPFLLLIFALCVWSSLVWLICVLGCFTVGLSCLGLWVCWTWVAISFPILGKFSTIISSSIFLCPFFLSSSSGSPVIRILGVLTPNDDRGLDGWMASPTQWTWVWVGDGQGSLVCCSPWGRKELDTTEQLNWTELQCFALVLSFLGLSGFLGLGWLFPSPF